MFEPKLCPYCFNSLTFRSYNYSISYNCRCNAKSHIYTLSFSSNFVNEELVVELKDKRLIVFQKSFDSLRDKYEYIIDYNLRTNYSIERHEGPCNINYLTTIKRIELLKE